MAAAIAAVTVNSVVMLASDEATAWRYEWSSMLATGRYSAYAASKVEKCEVAGGSWASVATFSPMALEEKSRRIVDVLNSSDVPEPSQPARNELLVYVWICCGRKPLSWANLPRGCMALYPMMSKNDVIKTTR